MNWLKNVILIPQIKLILSPLLINLFSLDFLRVGVQNKSQGVSVKKKKIFMSVQKVSTDIFITIKILIYANFFLEKNLIALLKKLEKPLINFNYHSEILPFEPKMPIR